MRLLATILPLLPVLFPIAGAAGTTSVPFSTRIWKNYKMGPPAIDFHPELDVRSGDMVINKTAGYEGFIGVCLPSPHPHVRTAD